MKKITGVSSVLATVALATVLTGCSVPKKVAYFQDVDTNAIIETVKNEPIKIKSGDKISIVVKSKDPEVSALFNLPTYSSRIGSQGSNRGAELRTYTGGTAEGMATYTVTPEGDIDFPVLGKIHLAGMTRAEAAAYIKGELMGRNLVKDPTVIIEFLSSGVSLMGEVNRPGRYDLNVDDLTLLEAIALAGDLTITGQRENIRVIRQDGEKINTYIVDLTDMNSLTKSPAYHLQQGDIIYVEPNTMRKRSTTVNGNNALSVSFWVSVASLLTSVVTTIAVFVNK